MAAYPERRRKKIVACDNKKPCACTYPGCPRHGKCCACIAHHQKDGGVPGCFFSKEGEALWDRSFQALLKDRGLA